jgi:hypothetical protein
MTTDDLNEIRLREQQRNAVIFKRKLTEEAGGMMSLDEVQALLKLASHEAVLNAVSARELLAVEYDGELRFPNFQFEGAKVRPGSSAVLQAAPTTSEWRLLQYFLYADDGLAGDKPIDLIRGSPEDIAKAVRFARRLEE